MNIFQSIITCFNKCITFSGRASRSECWYFILFQFICYMTGGKIDKTVLHAYMQSYQLWHLIYQYGPMAIILHIFFLLPTISVSCRRLHDTNRTGKWLLLVFTISGIMPLINWMGEKGTEGNNRFGPDPLPVKQP